ncbi:hypothetical protein CASFOL_020987 [Castilleja foliolosa]|uniref:F-box domain-containing protein n=1 Tax=Castilleja foliolosa TaxID=1961234 RepID=A0ABD3D2F5_9LAMI
MALNYSHRPVTPVFPCHTSEDNLWSPMMMVNGYLAESVPEKNAEGYMWPWHVNRGETEEWPFNFRGDGVDHHCCSSESNSKDIADLLPSDPFGMDMETTFTAISGWLEDLEVGYGGYLRSNNTGTSTSHENYGLFADWNLIWNDALTFQPFQKPCDEKLDVACVKGGIIGCSDEKLNAAKSERQFGVNAEGGVKSEGIPDEALVSILSCLGIKDLLSVERVCKSLCLTIRSEPWLWRNIYIDQPLSEKITDDALLHLASRADGKLQCLSLVECPKVTDDGIMRVLEMNPHLTKLFVPGCTRLTVEGVLDIIKTHNSNNGFPGIQHLRIGRLFGVTHEHFEELKSLLGPDSFRPENRQKPHFYHRGNFYLPFDDDRALDIEMCPRCEKFRLVYDCPAEACQVKGSAAQMCRACTFCIARCAQCGRCISDNEYEETFCLDLLCSDCFKQMLKCQDRLDGRVVDDIHGVIRNQVITPEVRLQTYNIS